MCYTPGERKDEMTGNGSYFAQRSPDGKTRGLLPGVRRGMKIVPDAKGACMTLLEISRDYKASAALLRKRQKELRQMMKTETDPQKLWHIRRRILDLTPMLTEMNELADLTAHYYDRGYWRNEKYTV